MQRHVSKTDECGYKEECSSAVRTICLSSLRRAHQREHANVRIITFIHLFTVRLNAADSNNDENVVLQRNCMHSHVFITYSPYCKHVFLSDIFCQAKFLSARRYANEVLWPGVCLSVCLSVTSRSSI